MNNTDLLALFDSIVEDLPPLARQSILHYRHENGICCIVEFNDERLKTIGSRHGSPISVAMNRLMTNEPKRPKWSFILREFLKCAPEDVVRTVLQHEIIHCFLRPYFLPEKALKGPIELRFELVTPLNFVEIDEIVADTTRTDRSIADREEQLVRKINVEWGCDEAAARKWLEEHALIPN